MFPDEIKTKLNLTDVLCPYKTVVFGREGVYIEGVKTVLLSGSNAVKARVKGGVIEVTGEELFILEIGGESLYVRGKIGGVSFA